MKTFLISAAFGLISTSAWAATHTYDFSASFLSKQFDAPASASLADSIQALSTITGQIVLDDTVVQVFSPDNIRYAAPTVTIDSIDMTLFERVPQFLTVKNEATDSVSSSSSGWGPGTTDGMKDSLSFIFADPTGTALSDASLPTPLDVNAFANAFLIFNSSYYTGGGTGTPWSNVDVATFRIDSLAAAAPVPLPAGIWLLGAGLAGLGLARRRRG